MKNVNYVVKNLKFLRKVNNLSQIEFAKRAKVSQATINRWEKNLMSPTIDNLLTVCESFNISLSDLVCIDIQNESNLTSQIDLLNSVASTSDGKIKMNIDNELTPETIIEAQKILMDKLNDKEVNDK